MGFVVGRSCSEREEVSAELMVLLLLSTRCCWEREGVGKRFKERGSSSLREREREKSDFVSFCIKTKRKWRCVCDQVFCRV